MKKTLHLLFVFILTLSFLAVSVPGSVLAEAGDTGSGVWVTPGSSLVFTTVNVDKAAAAAPKWLQQLSEGIVISAPAKICYPFRGGQFHWQPRIMQLSNGAWKNLTTTTEAIFTEEAVDYACASAPAAGTYALFGFYNGPVETKISGMPECNFEFEGKYIDFGDIYTYDGYFNFLVFALDGSTSGTVKYTIYDITSGTITSPLSGTATISNLAGSIYAAITDSPLTYSGLVLPSFSMRVEFPSGCYKNLTYIGTQRPR